VDGYPHNLSVLAFAELPALSVIAHVVLFEGAVSANLIILSFVVGHLDQ
jgi:hypothetical protein